MGVADHDVAPAVPNRTTPAGRGTLFGFDHACFDEGYPCNRPIIWTGIIAQLDNGSAVYPKDIDLQVADPPPSPSVHPGPNRLVSLIADLAHEVFDHPQTAGPLRRHIQVVE